MKLLFQILLLVMPLLYWAGCGDDENEDNPVIPGRKIYIAGSDEDGACYWVNGSRVELPGGDWATDIVVVDGDVYTSGTCGLTACYWINQERFDLPGTWGEGEAIAVDGDDVYVAGWFDNGSCYWKNGQQINLTINRDSQAFAIGIRNNGDVYVGGYYMSNHHYYVPCFWKNGNNRSNLPAAEDGEVYDITFDETGNMRYYAGNTTKLDNFAGYPPKACYWRHKTRTDLPLGGSSMDIYGSYANGITIDGDDVYLAGYTNRYEFYGEEETTGGDFPQYWKNSTIHDLEGGPMTEFGTGVAYDIRVADGNVIVVGIATRGPNYDDSGERKPSAVPFKMSLEALQLEPKETIMVGDWPERDVVGAQQIGMKTAFARYGDTFGTVNSGADWDLVDIYQLVMIINEYNGSA